MDYDEAESSVASRAALTARGLDRRAIADRRGIRRVGRGMYVSEDRWHEAWPDERHLMEIAACEGRGRAPDTVYSHLSAAVLHGLPLWGPPPDRVHVTGSTHNGGVTAGSPATARHRADVPATDVVRLGDLLATGVERTVADVLRCSPRATALVIADAALRRTAWNERARTYNPAAADRARDGIAARLRPGSRGVRQARELLALADGRAESPGESVSRLLLHDLGFARPRLQVRIDRPGGRAYDIDFGLDDAGVWGEYDGEVKYGRGAMVPAGTLQEVLRAEKEREDWIRGVTGRRVVRWTTADIRSAATLRAKLAHFRVVPSSNQHRRTESPPNGVHSGGESDKGW